MALPAVDEHFLRRRRRRRRRRMAIKIAIQADQGGLFLKSQTTSLGKKSNGIKKRKRRRVEEIFTAPSLDLCSTTTLAQR